VFLHIFVFQELVASPDLCPSAFEIIVGNHGSKVLKYLVIMLR
jgi:hypothetical protein